MLTGCTTFSGSFWHTSTEQLIENHQYQRAIDQVIAAAPSDKTLLFKIKTLAKNQNKKQSYKINQLIKQKKWGEARHVLEQLKENQPNAASLPSLTSLIDKAQHEEERIVNTHRALAEAKLLSVQFIQQDLFDRIHYNQINWFSPHQDLVSKKRALAEELLHLSTQALLVKDYKNAQKTYEKAIELDKELGAREITDAIKTGLSEQSNKAINERQESLIRQLYLAIDKKDFEYILKIQDILSNQIFNGPQVVRALTKATEIRQEYSKKLDTSASKEYRKGNISTAVTQWQQALILTPEEIDIHDKLLRAQKVQRKLDKLTSDEES
jgi:tetratricopeptide (TPR) repeat protein